MKYSPGESVLYDGLLVAKFVREVSQNGATLAILDLGHATTAVPLERISRLWQTQTGASTQGAPE